MLRIRSQGWTRQGEERHENQDAFRVVPALGLFLVVDAMTTARAAGNCQIHRLRLESARTLSDAHWNNPTLAGCLGAERLEVSERLLTVDHGDRYVMATDGALRLYGGVGPFDMDDALTLDVAGMSLDRIGPTLMSRACPAAKRTW